ncbi:Gas vesicle protein G [Micromonospora purpureochromogenes]|uniref:Gas vesicle protein G n=1 Tax=Micromonospora purpureochromogenes TaxID=47872 RepID=A0A1C4VC93_9ACTN|nr:gas vesicle protein GvpG [Micromonospora purpureochromogenes]SCE81607.1 Gas vesicle protein G [Micromonospora purpureochromogenes]
MEILWSLLTLPYAPVRGLTAVVKVIAREAESQLHSPINIRRELEELDEAAAAGEITAEERDRGQQQVLERLSGSGSASGSPSGSSARPEPQRRAAGRRGDPDHRRRE